MSLTSPICLCSHDMTEDCKVVDVVRHGACPLCRKSVVSSCERLQRLILHCSSSGRRRVVLNGAIGEIVDVVFDRVSHSIPAWCIRVVGKFRAIEVRCTICQNELLLTRRSPVKGSLCNPVVCAILGIARVGRVSAIAPSPRRVHKP